MPHRFSSFPSRGTKSIHNRVGRLAHGVLKNVNGSHRKVPATYAPNRAERGQVFLPGRRNVAIDRRFGRTPWAPRPCESRPWDRRRCNALRFHIRSDARAPPRSHRVQGRLVRTPRRTSRNPSTTPRSPPESICYPPEASSLPSQSIGRATASRRD